MTTQPLSGRRSRPARMPLSLAGDAPVEPSRFVGTHHLRPVWSGGRIIWRAALAESLTRAVEAPVCLVVAPAGSGKTLLVRSWLQTRGPHQPTAWVSVERAERDGQRFWGTVGRAIRGAMAHGMTVEVSAPTPSFDSEAVVRQLVSSLGALEEPLVLVFDDLHDLVAEEIVEEFRYFLDHLPDLLHVILISRRDLPLGLHRRRLAGGLSELRGRDLSFSLAETEQLLSLSGVDLSRAGVRSLHDRTEGWAAGLRFALLSLAAHDDPEQFVTDFSGSERSIAEYLVEEVLDSLLPHVRRMLVRTSILDRVNGELGDLLGEGRGAERALRALADADGFVVALDTDRQWFRFHHLFADLLATELRNTEPELVARMHLRAARWYAEHDDVIEAVAHAELGGDHDLAAGLLVEHYFSLTLDGRQASARVLLDGFAPAPVDVVAPEVLAVMAAEELVHGSLHQASAYLAHAERQAGKVPEARRRRFDTALLITRLNLARRLGDFRSVLADVQRAGPALHDPAQDAVRHLDVLDNDVLHNDVLHNDVRALTLMNLGIVEVWSGKLTDGTRHLEEADELSRQIGRPYLQVSCQVHWAHATSWRSFTEARAASLRAIELAESHGWGADPVICPAFIMLAGALIQAGRLDEAERALSQADETLRPDLEPALGFLRHLSYGSIHLARGHHTDAVASYRDAERLGLRLLTDSPLTVEVRCLMLGAMVHAGEAAAVREAVAGMSPADRASGEFREVAAVLALDEGDAGTAGALLAPTLDGTATCRHVLVLIRSLVREARAQDTLGDPARVERALERALDLAEPDALFSPFLHVQCRDLLERHSPHRTSHGAFLAEVLNVLSERRATLPAVVGAHDEPGLAELSHAELRVLRLLPTNLPIRHIAGEIYVSANTIKTHIRHIYGKLGAHNRVEAVRRGRELGLLSYSGRHE